jgi:hypothetical protein
MSLFNEEPWHFAFRWKGRCYRGSCKTSRQLEDGQLPWNKKVPTLAGFSNRFLTGWSGCRQTVRLNRQPAGITGGWQLLESTSIAGMKLDHITADNALTIEGSSAANTNNALRTLRRTC